MTWPGFARHLGHHDFHVLIDEVIDAQLAAIRATTDADVVFQPHDPHAKELFSSDTDAAWTLGHVIVHATASSEEAAAVALDLARGVNVQWRSRYETPWGTVTTVAGCRQRLEESRRMRHGLLSAWPDSPSAEQWRHYYYTDVVVDCYARFLMGISHEEGHLEQLREIMRQAKAAKAAKGGEGIT